MLTKLQRTHLIVFAMAMSPCRQFVAVCTNFGHLLVLRLRDALRRRVDATDRPRLLQCALRPFAPHGAFCLRTWDQWLLCGAQGRVEAWSWSQLIAGKATRPVWAVPLPRGDDLESQVDIPEVNSLAVAQDSESQAQLYAGSGDNLIHLFDLSNGGAHIRSFQGHTEYVHAVTTTAAASHSPTGSKVASRSSRYHLASASEDGTVRLWDVRQARAGAILEPESVSELARPRVGRWITSLAADPQSEDWLVCGGGPQLANWHLTALRPTATFDYAPMDFSQCALFYDDLLITVGSDQTIRHWQLNGQSHAAVPAQSGHGMHVLVSSVLGTNDNVPTVEEEGEDVEAAAGKVDRSTEHILVCGNSNKVDVCSRLGYVIFSLEL